MSTFLARQHPRGGAGRFVPAPQSFPEVTIEVTDAHERRLDVARGVLDDFSDLEMSDHSSDWAKDTVTLGEMGDPDIAKGNCWIVTNEILEQAGLEEFEASTLKEAAIVGRGHHVALLVEDRDGAFIVDYTIRQFDASLPFPFVGSVAEWFGTIERATGVKWDWYDDDDDDDDDE